MGMYESNDSQLSRSRDWDCSHLARKSKDSRNGDIFNKQHIKPLIFITVEDTL